MRTVLAVFAAALCPAQTISIGQLTHRVPSSAAREYRASIKALGSGDIAQSIAHCQKAIEADPGNGSAHNDLGVLYLSDGKTEQALAEFNREIEIEPRSAVAQLNSSFALLALGRPRDAEGAARKAIEIERGNRRAHLLLGWSLASQFRFTSEALESLRRAVSDFPEAYLAEADVLVHRGSITEARAAVEAYIATGSAEQKPIAEAWLRLLTIE